MTKRFDWFVLIGGMRTGSNLLETFLNAAEGVTCHGEAFNPHFVGYPNRAELLGVDLMRREADPQALVDRIVAQPGLNGFRLFDGHDPRVLARAVADPRCAKIVLSRKPLDSFLSLGIAKATGQWKLGDVKSRKSARIDFDGEAFAAFLAGRDRFHADLLRQLQVSGQTAFWIGYDDLSDAAVVNGLLAYLGVPPLDTLASPIVRQNPGSPADKVTDPAAMDRAVRAIDWAGLTDLPMAESGRGPQVPSYIASATQPLLYMPVPGVPDDWVLPWLSGPEGTGAPLVRNFNQKSLRQWLKDNPAHRAFTVVRHPLSRAWTAFGVALSDRCPPETREVLRRSYGVGAPGAGLGDLPPELRKTVFMAFLRFLKANLDGQTSLRTTPLWASQTAVITGFAGVLVPDVVIRAGRLAADAALLSPEAGALVAKRPEPVPPSGLAEVVDGEVQALCRAAYARDFVNFGFSDWTDQAA